LHSKILVIRLSFFESNKRVRQKLISQVITIKSKEFILQMVTFVQKRHYCPKATLLSKSDIIVQKRHYCPKATLLDREHRRERLRRKTELSLELTTEVGLTGKFKFIRCGFAGISTRDELLGLVTL